MQIELEMCLQQRTRDRVVVKLNLTPTAGVVHVDGAAIDVLDASGRPVCPRHLVPVSGELSGPTSTTVELRSLSALPDGAQIVAVAWCGNDQETLTVPAEPSSGLRERLFGPGDAARFDPADVLLEALLPEEIERLATALPWVQEPVVRIEAVAVIDAVPNDVHQAAVDDVAEAFGLDEDDAAWLRDLLDEE